MAVFRQNDAALAHNWAADAASQKFNKMIAPPQPLLAKLMRLA
jgi:hypothetical protein